MAGVEVEMAVWGWRMGVVSSLGFLGGRMFALMRYGACAPISRLLNSYWVILTVEMQIHSRSHVQGRQMAPSEPVIDPRF